MSSMYVIKMISELNEVNGLNWTQVFRIGVTFGSQTKDQFLLELSWNDIHIIKKLIVFFIINKWFLSAAHKMK